MNKSNTNQSDVQANKQADQSSMRRLGGLLRPYIGRLSRSLLAMIALAGVNMIVPAFIAILFNQVFPNNDWGLLFLMLIGLVVVYTSRNLLYFISKYSAVYVGENVCFQMRKNLFERMQSQNIQYYKQHKPGEVSSRVMDDSYVIQSFIQDDLPTALQAICMFVALIGITYAVNWQLALASTIVLPFHIYTIKRFKIPIKQASRKAQEQLAVVHGNLIEKFLGIEVVKGFTGEQRESEAFVRAIDSSRESQLTSKKFHVTQKIVADLIVGLGTIFLLGFGGYQVMKGTPDAMKPGTFIAFFGYIGMLYPTVLTLMSSVAKLTKTSASIDRVHEMLERQLPEDAMRSPVVVPIRGELSFENVCFRYDDGPPLLKNINLHIPAGKVCAIVGPSGGGKSTFVSLVPRFLDPDLGQIKVDGVNVKRLDMRHLRASIGIAFQECFLFNTSVFENLRYAQPDATMSQIVSVAKRTGAHDFINKLPDGYATIIGENGVTLSRGEKQRITLTRAMLKNPRILVLDEATASIDIASESAIIPEILDFMKGKTTLMVTHRPELLRHADIVVHLDDGRVVYQGAPDGLLEKPAAPVAKESYPMLSVPKTIRNMLIPFMIMLSLMFGGNAAHAQETPPTPPTPPAAPAPPAAAPATPPATPPAAAPAPAIPNGEFVSQPGLARVEIDEMMQLIQTKMSLQHGYRKATAEQAARLRETPVTMTRLMNLVKEEDGSMKLIQVGYHAFRSQPVHIWYTGKVFTGDEVKNNADVLVVKALIAETKATLDAHNKSMKGQDLAVGKISLSYIEADRCMAILKTLGYQTVEYNKGTPGSGKAEIIAPSSVVDPTKLPIVTSMPDTKSTDLVGGSKAQGGSFGLVMTPSIANNLDNPTASDPVMDLMVLYHPAHPEQFSNLINRIKTSIDLPARQILIEAMVLEISDTDLKELGVQWEFEGPAHDIDKLTIGKLPTLDAEDSALDAEIGGVFGEFKTKLRALIREGRANILSRPSVLTLDNRQASIRVGDEIPVAKSLSGIRTGDKIAFDFNYIPVGILLNVRPRVSAEGEEISMQIDGIVSSSVPGQDLVILEPGSNQILASAPKISTRRVQTYSRIGNNTPFIIGGLVKKDEFKIDEKTPVLGDLPLIGGLFSNTEDSRSRSEVIIVITPYVLPEEQRIGRNLPKDEDAFDSFGNDLFRDAYRIRSEDVYDLDFLFGNDYVNEMKTLADRVIKRDFRYADKAPFSWFAGKRIPGEDILVYRQMYEVLKRLKFDEKIETDKIIFFHPDDRWEAGFAVTFLEKYLKEIASIKQQGKVEDIKGMFAAIKGKALAMTYTVDQKGIENSLSQPVPKLKLVDCPNDEIWAQLLWKMNQKDEHGRQQYTILVRDEYDLVRLKRAMLLKRTVKLNASNETLSLANFSLGRLLLMPSPKEDKVHLVDADTAKFFFLTEHYYPALGQRLTRGIRKLRDALESDEIKQLLPDLELPAESAIVLPPK